RVVKIELYVDSVLFSSNTRNSGASITDSFSLNTRMFSNGLHTFSGKAYDAAGNEGDSATITVNFKNTTTILISLGAVKVSHLESQPLVGVVPQEDKPGLGRRSKNL